jgi:hypothetical protein
MEISSLLVLYTKADSELATYCQIDTDQILTLTPDAYLSLNPNYKNVIRSIDHFSNLDHLEVIDRVRDIELDSDYLEYIKILNDESVKEVFKHEFHVYIGMYERLKSTVPLAKKYFFISNNKILSCSTKKELIIKILTKIIYEENHRQISIKPSIYSGVINSLNHISSILLSNYQIIAYTGDHYGLPNLINCFKNYDNKLRFVRFRGSKNNITDIFKSLFTFISILFRRKKIVFTISPQKLKSHILFDEIIKCAKTKDIEEEVDLYKKTLLSHLTLTSGLLKSYKDILKKIKPIFLIAHEMKYSSNASLADAAKQLKINSYLISHGTHVATFNNDNSNYEQKEMANGLLASRMATFNITQSSIAVKAIESFFPELDYIKYSPIMWGYNTIRETSAKNKNGTIHFLHASTFKCIPATRPWIFESSDEFYVGIKELIEVVSKIENIFLTIRLRLIPECDLIWIKKLALNAHNVKIKSDGSFIEDLYNSDSLISNSSTTIEEAVTLNKNVLLWGYGSRYSHTQENTNDRRINSNANSKESLKEEIIILRNQLLNGNKENLKQNSKPQNTIDDFVVNSLLFNKE